MLYSELKNNQKLINNLEVDSYLPILFKRAIVHGINNEEAEIDGLISSCIELKDSMYYVDYAKLAVSKFYLVIMLYTKLEFDTEDSTYEIYDFCISNGLYDHILSKISDLKFLEELIDKEIQQYLAVRHSLSYIVARGINQLITKMPDEKDLEKLLKKIPNLINKIKPENLEIFKDILTKN